MTCVKFQKKKREARVPCERNGSYAGRRLAWAQYRFDEALRYVTVKALYEARMND